MAKKQSSSVSLPQGEPITASDPVVPAAPVPPAPEETAPARPSIAEKDLSASSANQAVFDLARHHRTMLYDTIQNGTFPLLPDKDGRIDTSRPQNVVSGYQYKGPTILILKAHQAAHGFPTAEYVSENHLEEANRRAGLHGTTLRNPHPVTISISDSANPDSNGKPSVKFIRLYNLAEAAHPDAVRDLAGDRAVEREQNFNAWQDKKAQEAPANGETFERRDYYPPRQRESSYAYQVNQRDPEKYLGQVFTAMSLGTKNVHVNPAVSVNTVKDNLINYLYQRDISKTTGKEIDNPFSIYSLGNKASAFCKENLKKIFTKPEQNNPQQSRTQSQQMADMAMGM